MRWKNWNKIDFLARVVWSFKLYYMDGFDGHLHVDFVYEFLKSWSKA